MEKHDKKVFVENLIIYYFACAFLGWILETLYAYSIFGTFVKRGFLYGIICPIYGYGAVILILITEALKKRNVNYICTFFMITTIFTLLEYIASLVLELLFGIRWWDYRGEFLNLQGRVCLMFSILFGLMGIVFIKRIYNPTKKMIKKLREKIPSNILDIILVVIIAINIADTIFSVIRYI